MSNHNNTLTKESSFPLFLERHHSFQFNPFGGITKDELSNIIVPRQATAKIISLIHNERPAIIELVGKKGRGKTTHLIYLQQHFPENIILHLNGKNQFDESILKEKILFIDSIHHFNFFQRIKIFKQVSKIILTTHHGRKLEYTFANKKSFSFRFKGLDKNTLLHVLEKRILSAAHHPNQPLPLLNESYIDDLLKKYKDDFRGILNHLYTDFQNTVQP